MKKLPSNLKRIISLLNKGDFISGSAIGDKLKITRSAVWKYMKQLETYGIEIISDKTRGYAMQQPIVLLDALEIIKNCSDVENRFSLEVFNSLDSTSDYLKKSPRAMREHSEKKLQICLTEQQTKGRGRFGRSWLSPFGKNIYFSCLWNVQKDISELAGLSLVVGMAVIKTLKNIGISEAIKIKWPNDILYLNKKLAGVLIEINAETHGHSQVIIGIGLNINMLDDDGEIGQGWTSLQTITNNQQDRNLIVALLIQNLLVVLDQFQEEGFKSFQKEWLQHDALLHKKISLDHGRKTVTGVVCGVNDQGNLLLRHADESLLAYSSGDASIKK